METGDEMWRFRRWTLLQVLVTLAALVTLLAVLWKLTDIDTTLNNDFAQPAAKKPEAPLASAGTLAVALVESAQALIESQNFAESARALDTALTVIPDAPKALFLRGNTFVVAGDLAAAAKAYSKAGDYSGAAALALACAESANAVRDELLSQERHAEVGALATQVQHTKRAVYHQWIDRLTAVGFSSVSQADDGGFVLTVTDSVDFPAMREFRQMPVDSLRFYHTKVADLSPLAGFQIRVLDLRESAILSLKPLAGMPLRKLDLENCRQLTSLDGLQGIGLTELRLDGCIALETLEGMQGNPVKKLTLTHSRKLKDLSALRGLPIEELRLGTSYESNSNHALETLDGLQGTALKTLDLHNCITLCNLSAIRGLPITHLQIAGCHSLDSLDGLQDMGLTTLDLSGCRNLRSLDGLQGNAVAALDLRDKPKLSSIEALRSSPVRRITFFSTYEEHAAIALISIDGLQGTQLEELDLTYCKSLTSLLPLKGLPIKKLTLGNCMSLRSLDGLQNMGLTELKLDGCKVLENLNGLQGNAIESLVVVSKPWMHDISALADTPLRRLVLGHLRGHRRLVVGHGVHCRVLYVLVLLHHQPHVARQRPPIGPSPARRASR